MAFLTDPGGVHLACCSGRTKNPFRPQVKEGVLVGCVVCRGVGVRHTLGSGRRLYRPGFATLADWIGATEFAVSTLETFADFILRDAK